MRFRASGIHFRFSAVGGCLLAVLAAGALQPVWADVRAGVSAYKRGDYAVALREFRTDAETGDRRAQYNLGVLFMSGRGVEKSKEKAAEWYLKAAEQGLPAAQHGLAILYYRGQGVAQNHLEAAKWFRKAADKGMANAQFNLGVMYFNAEGVEKNLTEVVKWISLSAGQNFADAQYWLGIMYENGVGLASNPKEALKWFQLAAEKGHDKAPARAAAVVARIEAEETATSEQSAAAADAARPETRSASPVLAPSALPDIPDMPAEALKPKAAAPVESKPVRREAVTAPPAPPAPPAAPPESPPAAETAAPPRAQANAPAAREWRVQFASLKSLQRAEKAWRELISAHGQALAGKEPIYQRVDLGPGKGVFHRLQTGPFASRTAARALCRGIVEKTPRQACLVVRSKSPQ